MTPTVFFFLVLIGMAWASVVRMIGEFTWSDFFALSAAGFIGATTGSLLATAFEWPSLFGMVLEDQVFPVVWAIIFAGIFVSVLGVLLRLRGKATPSEDSGRTGQQFQKSGSGKRKQGS